MSTHFCLTVRFLQPYSHGRGSDSEPEWPPSPLRVFQALVSATAARWNERMRVEYAAPALRWLERQPEPIIVAAHGVRSDVKYRLYVPDNVADKVARSWSGGREASIADYRTEKDVRPTHLLGDAVHYLFPIVESDSEFEKHRNTLIEAARSITHLGWGVDMVVGNATVLSEEDAAKLPGERWRPAVGSSASPLRVPTDGTLNDLAAKHTAFLNRLPASGGFVPVPPLTAFRVIGYRHPTDIAPRPFAAFSLLKPDASGFRPFDTPRWAVAVAGMVRHALAVVAKKTQPFGMTDQETDAFINTFVHGHTPDGNDRRRGAGADQRFAFLPLPTINRIGRVEMIRRVLVVGPPGGSREVAWARRALAGCELVPEGGGGAVAVLSVLPQDDPNVRPYTGGQRGEAVWSTVTPVVRPGFDDGDAAKAGRLLRKAFEQAGVPPELAWHRETVVKWRQVGFRAGVDLATRYRRPGPGEAPRFHVRVRWPVPVRGPLFVGAARYRGLGLFAAERAG
jgi:CRISPR-associated protein Csb2